MDEAFVFLVLERDSGFTYACIMTNDTASVLRELQPLVGRTIALSGHEITPTIVNRAITKRQISVSSLANIRIASGEDCDPFAVSSLSDAPPSLNDLAAPTPRKTAGTVAARWQSKIILRDAAGESIIVEFRDGIDLPAIGESIEAAGIPVTDLYRIHLDEAIWRKSNAAPAQPDKPVDTPLETIFRHHGVFIMNPQFFGQTLCVKGTLHEFVTDESGNKRLLLENDGLTIQIDCSNAPDASMIQLGSVVSATGVIGYHVAALQTSLAGADEASSGRLSTVAKMIKSCLIDLRRCLWDLRNDVLDEPDFAEAIRRTVEPVARDAELHIRFDGRRALLSDATAHALLNVVRERPHRWRSPRGRLESFSARRRLRLRPRPTPGHWRGALRN